MVVDGAALEYGGGCLHGTLRVAPVRGGEARSMGACLPACVQMVDDYRSAAAGGRRVTATKRTGFASFPRYLVLTLQR